MTSAEHAEQAGQVFEAEGPRSIAQELSPIRWAARVRADLRALHRARFVIQGLVLTQLTARYHRSALGMLWSLISPLLLLSVQAFAFSQLLGINARTYAVYLFSGLVAWQFLAAAIDAGSRSLMSSEPLVRAVMAPALVFPISEVIVALVHAGLALIALFALALLVGAPLRPQLVLLPAGIALLVLFTLGLVLIAMTVVTFFRDLEHVMQVLLLAYYFASPVIYPAEAIQRYRVVLTLNPMTYYLDIFRAAFVGLPGLPTDLGAGGSYWPAASVWLIATASACGSFAIGYVVYKRHERAYIFQL